MGRPGARFSQFGGAGGGGGGGSVDGPMPVPSDQPAGSSKIRAFSQRMGAAARHEDSWDRTPNVTGRGAIHCRSFHCKLTDDGLAFLDQQVNEWLDAHPQYEVKMVTSAIGEWTGKVREPNLVVTVWV
jgi:hypothetical protein